MNPFHRLHRWIDDAPWSRPALDRLAASSSRVRVPTLLDRGAPDRPRPIAPHLVSVVVPCYNYAHFLPTAVASALGQDDVAVEVIVVDDASTDTSAAVAAQLAAADDRVHLLRNPENAGHIRSFNAGAARAAGEFLVKLDADDLLAPGALARALALFESWPSVGLVYGHPRPFTAEPPSPRTGTASWTVWPGRAWIGERCRRGVNCLTTPEAVIRASVARTVGSWNPRLRFAADMEMWLRVAAASDVARINDVDQALHRDHETSMSATTGAGALLDLVERRQVFDEFFHGTGRTIADAQALHATARRNLAREAVDRAQQEVDRNRFDTALIHELLEFARSTEPSVVTDRAWKTLRRRLARGPRRRPRPDAFVRASLRRGLSEIHYLRWVRSGL